MCGTSPSTATTTSSRCTSRRSAASSVRQRSRPLAAPATGSSPVAARSSRFTVRARVTAFAPLLLAGALVGGAVVANRLLVRALIDDVDASLENRLDQVIGLTTEG